MITNPNIIIRSTPKYVSVIGENPAISIPPVSPPTSENSPGKPGELRFDLNTLYICVSNNFWKKINLLNFDQ